MPDKCPDKATATSETLKTVNDKFEKISGKVISVGVSVFIAIMGMLYSDIKSRVETIEGRITHLYQDKISREEVRQQFIEIKKEMAEGRAEQVRLMNSMRQDMIDRLDLIVRYRLSNEEPRN